MTGDTSRISMPESKGWTMRFAADEPRLSEAVEMYRHAGFEVLLAPLDEDGGCKGCAGVMGSEGRCRVCFDGLGERYRMIFTRPLKTGRSSSVSGYDFI